MVKRKKENTSDMNIDETVDIDDREERDLDRRFNTKFNKYRTVRRRRRRE